MSAILLPKRLPSTALRSLSRLASSGATPKHVPAPVKEAVSPATTPVVGQAPNRALKWSTNQQSRPQAASLPRFEQTDMSLQPQPLSAMEMIAKEPVRLVHGRKAVCDGGGGPLGHPKIFINLDQPGPRSCGYCGLRFEQVHHHH